MKGFASSRRFRGEETLASTLGRNWRELTTFINTHVVRFESDATNVVLPGDLTVGGITTLTGDIASLVLASGGTISGSSGSDIDLYGGPGSTGARLLLFSSDHSSFAKDAYLDADEIVFRNAAGLSTTLRLTSAGGWDFSGRKLHSPLDPTAGDNIGDRDYNDARYLTEESWTAPTLVNSWVNYAAGEQAARYRKDLSGVVHVQGLVKSGTTTSGTTVFTLPAGYRPDAHMIFATVASGDVHAAVKVTTAGLVQTRGGWSATWTSINLSFAT